MVTLCIHLTGSVFSSNYTVPRHPRVVRRRCARDAANLFSPSLEISDDVRALLPPVPPPGEVVSARPRESREIYQSAHLSRTSQYIFKIAYTLSMYYGVARRDENLSLRQKPKVNVPRPPKNTRGASFSVAVRSVHHFRRLSCEECFTSGERSFCTWRRGRH